MSVRKRQRNPINTSKEDKIRELSKLDFSWSSPRQTVNFGWGKSGNGDISNSFVSTEDVRLALDKAFRERDTKSIRAVSQHFFKTSGVYASAARYLAYMPTYDYMLNPVIIGMNVDEKTIMREVIKQLRFLDSLKFKTTFRNIALDVIVEGVYYAYFRRSGNKSVIQKMPTEWCRTRGFSNGFPIVEFNLDYFKTFGTKEEKIIALNSFPPEIILEYNKLSRDSARQENTSSRRLSQSLLSGSQGTWITLDPSRAVAFYLNSSLQPLLANSFFSILDVLELKGIEKKKAENELYNLVVQQFQLNDDYEPAFDIVEMQAYHDSAKSVFSKTKQSDLITTFADVKNLNLNEAASEPIDFTGWNKDVYSEMGVSQQLFSTEGNMALEKSQNVDMSLIFSLVEKFEDWINLQLDVNFNKEIEEDMFYTRVQILRITDHNRKEMATLYKDFGTLGYLKMLPAVALGQSQIQIMSALIFENNILNLEDVMVPLKSSHTASAGGDGGSSTGGRPPLPESQKSDKTIANMN